MQNHNDEEPRWSSSDGKGRWLAFTLAFVLAFVGGAGCKHEENLQEAKPNVGSKPSLRAVTVPAAPVAKPDAILAPAPGPKEKAETGGGKSRAARCADICNISKPLSCRNARECVPRCESMASAPVCVVEIEGLFDCLRHQPTKNWECDEDGIGAIRDPFCGKEQARLAGCLEARLGH
jgi:hypothetical protein